ncbi:hypothetical protein ACN27G_08905 [Plantactinospora sp. WMMB334]|uniref:hypothetical protein n=1 Tax=Plantactinospora sp. WMMB334 TaxID=3404119 RepID=UPI003B94C352
MLIIRRIRRALLLPVVLAVVAATGSAATGAPPVPTGPTGSESAADHADLRWITLVTGDRVLVETTGTGTRVRTVTPGPGRRDMSFVRQTRGDTFVIPADAAALVAGGRVDRRAVELRKADASAFGETLKARLMGSALPRDGAPAGRRTTVPVTVGRQAGATYGRLTTLDVAVSLDDGATWQPAAVTGGGPHRDVTVDHPIGAGFVPLRATAEDDEGNAVTETIIRAYGLRG